MRVLVGGAWGFACDRRLDQEGARGGRPQAAAFARAAPGGHSRELAPLEPARGEYRTPVERDPFAVPLAEKVELCLRAEQALAHEDVKVDLRPRSARSASTRSSSPPTAPRPSRSSSSAAAASTRWPRATGSRRSAATRAPTAARAPRPAGSTSRRSASSARRRASPSRRPRCCAPTPCPSGVTTVVIDDEQMALQVHESVGHPTELDRVYGTEAAYAGTSFLKPDDLGSLRYGSEHMNITADSTTPGGLGTFGFDDEGVPAGREPIVGEGILSGFLTSRETAARIGSGAGGSMRADSWSRMPLVRMTNLHLEPGEGSLEELIADADDGVFLQTNKSWSIDDKRLNFQFGTQIAWEIKGGKLGRMLRDATYTGADARLLGLARRRRRPRRVAAARADELRQGPARAARARLARRLPGPLPQRAGRLQAVSALELAGKALQAVEGDEALAARVRPSAPAARASPARRCTSRP